MVVGPGAVGAGGGLLVAGELVAGEVWVAGNAVVAGCGPPSLFASLGLGWSFGGFVAGELVVEAEAGADEGVVLATERRPGFS